MRLTAGNEAQWHLTVTQRLRRGLSTDVKGDMAKAFENYSKAPALAAVEFKSSFEKELDAALTAVGITHIYEICPFPLYLSSDKKITFTPDFATGLFIGKKRVLIEPHGCGYFRLYDIDRYALFMNEYGRDYYLIVVTEANAIYLKRLRRGANRNHRFADEVWCTAVDPNTGVDGFAVNNTALHLKLAELKARAAYNGNGAGTPGSAAASVDAVTTAAPSQA